MHVLVVHNRYRSANPSGENVVVADEVAALRDAGVEVSTYVRDSDEIPSFPAPIRALTGLRPIFSPTDVAAITRTVRGAGVDLVHLHNVQPLISPGFIPAVRRAGVPLVQTVHNHRLVCSNGTFFRDGHPCQDCLGRRFPWPAIQHGCYQDSSLRSVPVAVSLAVHRRNWRSLDRYLALTPALAEYLVSAGVPPERIVVRPNTTEDPLPDERPAPGPASGFVFVSRLAEDKGLRLLLDAWRLHPPHQLGTLTVIGDGPDAALVADVAAQRSDVTALGFLDRAAVQAAMRQAAAVVVPSLVPDVFPRVVVEALALGRPVVATAVGGLPTIVDDSCGWLVEPDAARLAEALKDAYATATGKQAAARRRYLDRYSPGVVLQQLLEVYASCLRDRRP